MAARGNIPRDTAVCRAAGHPGGSPRGVRAEKVGDCGAGFCNGDGDHVVDGRGSVDDRCCEPRDGEGYLVWSGFSLGGVDDGCCESRDCEGYLVWGVGFRVWGLGFMV